MSENLNEELNKKMALYKENVNVVAKINVELTKKYGLEHYLTDFSSNLITALNQYERFIFVLDKKEEYIDIIIKFSDAAVDFFNMSQIEDIKKISIFKRKKVLKENYNNNLEKINKLVITMNSINDFINTNITPSIKKYMEDEKESA